MQYTNKWCSKFALQKLHCNNCLATLALKQLYCDSCNATSALYIAFDVALKIYSTQHNMAFTERCMLRFCPEPAQIMLWVTLSRIDCWLVLIYQVILKNQLTQVNTGTIASLLGNTLNLIATLFTLPQRNGLNPPSATLMSMLLVLSLDPVMINSPLPSRYLTLVLHALLDQCPASSLHSFVQNVAEIVVTKAPPLLGYSTFPPHNFSHLCTLMPSSTAGCRLRRILAYFGIQVCTQHSFWLLTFPRLVLGWSSLIFLLRFQSLTSGLVFLHTGWNNS